PRLWLSGKDAARAVGDHVRSFSLLSCTTCGQHYFESWNADFFAGAGPKDQPEGGDRVGSGRQWEHLAEDLGGQRVLFVDRLVVRPEEDEDLEEEEEASSGHDFSHRRLLPLWICNRCGALHAQASSSCTACLAATPPVEIQVVRSKKDNPGVLGACVACRAPGRRPAGGNFREPARPVRAVGVSDVHVLAQSMIHLSERPRLLVFADNRQDAAFQAGWMRDHARRFRLRALMAQQIPPEGASVGDIALGLDGLLECDRDLSRALIPEVWQVVPQEEAGSRHREERLYFLRVQVLRELTTGVKQRLGLEPWGRLKVIYQGLTPDMEWIRSRATALGCPPEQLCEGVAALLDHLRRSRILWDATTKLFNQHWGSENREIQAGYFPPFAGGPRGVMYSRGPDNLPARALQWVGSRPTQMWNAVETWGFSEDQIEPFLEELWSFLRREKFLVPAPLEGWGKALKGSAGVWQVNAGKLLVKPHRGRWRCERCRRTTLRHGPGQSCMAWRCGGRLTWEIDDRDDFDLHTLDQNYALLRVAEHS
ncbi:MAG TPA: helicase, partial [Myxococcota bacterium]|nr:helicase [Myxococcota bacterium]